MPIACHRILGHRRSLIIVGLLSWYLVGCQSSTSTADGPDTDRLEIQAVVNSEEPPSDRTVALLSSVTVFVLAIFVGFEVITKVPPTLHTPLMSGSNAISGITLVGSILTAGVGNAPVAAILGCLAVILATINVVGGFLVTERMLSMFKKK